MAQRCCEGYPRYTQTIVSTPIAVITVTYSPGTYLESFLDSIPGATERAAYVVLADNGSTDGVPEQQADKRENVEFFATGGNLGYGTAINRAVQHLKERKERGDIDGDFFVVSNPDVVFDPGSIDAMLECAHRWPGAATIGPRIREADGAAYPSARTVPTIRNGVGHALFGTIWPSNPWTKAYRDDDDLTTEHPAGWLSGSCLLVRWDAFDAIGGFDERYFMYMEDVDLGDRFGRAGYSNVLCPSAEITHAKGHAAGENPAAMLPAHHDSAYRFIADRHAAWWQAPLRLVVRIGLKMRACIAVYSARRGQAS